MRQGNIQVSSENILPVIKKWLYSDQDIFLRELVANGCDAIRKLGELTRLGEAQKTDEKPRIGVFVDKDASVIRVEDNGIGMTEEEVEKYITQVAFSGAQDFIEKYQKSDGPDAGIIGHFGLGFYSAFMVAESVEIDTLSCREEASPVHWVSNGETTYEIGEGQRAGRGTTVTLHIGETGKDFLDENRLRATLRKYCAFMPVEIYFNPKGETVSAEGTDSVDGTVSAEGTAPAENNEDKPVNNPSPLWLKAPKDCTDEEYKQFYSELFLDFNPPLFWIHLNVDYPFNLKGILYFPRLGDRPELMPGEIKLYSKGVFIADNVKEVVPEFLMLLKGAIDCPDLPLNVSRSFLQNDGDVQKIAKHIAKKVSDKLHEIFNENREQYTGYWEDLAPFIKYGCIRDEGFYERVKDIVLFKTIEGDCKTLAEYPRGKDGKVVYVSDEAAQAPYVRMFRDAGQNAVVLGHPLDGHFISFLEYTEKDLRFARIDAELDDSIKNADGTDTADDAEKIADTFKETLKAAGLGDVTVQTERLKAADTPAVMLLSEYGRRMQEMSRLSGESFPGGAPETTVVLNLGNEAVRSIPTLPDDLRTLVCRQVYDLAKLSHRQLKADEAADFITRSAKLLGMAAKAAGTAGDGKTEEKPE